MKGKKSCPWRELKHDSFFCKPVASTSYHFNVIRVICVEVNDNNIKVKVKPSRYRLGQAHRVLRKLRFPDFVTTAQDGGRLSALRTGHLYAQEILLVLISVTG